MLNKEQDAPVAAISPDDVIEAMRGWATSEIKAVSDRYAGLSKFFFGASVGGFAIPAFLAGLGLQTSFDSAFEFLPFLLLSASIAPAIMMALPVSFSINQSTQIIREHRRFVRRRKLLTWLWLTSWSIGVSLMIGTSLNSQHIN
jgi:hypothetical protein